MNPIYHSCDRGISNHGKLAALGFPAASAAHMMGTLRTGKIKLEQEVEDEKEREGTGAAGRSSRGIVCATVPSTTLSTTGLLF